jgi:hypothetical protein
MSFVSILKRIGAVATGIEQIAVPAAEAALPQFAPLIAEADGIFKRLQTTVATVEASNPADGQGQLKAQAVTTDFQASLELVQQVLALEGKTLTYDDTSLQTAINSQVAAYNAMAQIQASFKIVPITPAP